VPIGDDEAKALKVVGEAAPPRVAVKAAVGGWSGAMAIANGVSPTGIGVPTVFVAVATGTTVLGPERTT